ncbi:MAG: hypothetical protein IJ436_03270 [Bacteroidaceae bacterium]|nr:hypothetical protein [Bacteroidaceae bacterium]
MKITDFTLLLLATTLFYNCNSSGDKNTQELTMTGVWALQKVTFPTGYTYAYPDKQGYTRCKIYEPDSTFYHVELLSAGSDMIVIPQEMAKYTFVHDNSDTLLVENGRFMMYMSFVNDTTYTVQNNLELETWVKVNTMSNHRRNEIKNIVKHNIDKRDSATTNFVLSTSERELRRTNNELIYLLTISLLFIGILALYGWQAFKKNIVIKQELEQIREQNNLLPQPVAMAMQQVEQDFFGSEYYRILLGRIERGEILKDEEFYELEQKLKPVYPSFTSRLRHLCHMSVHEFRVCLLLKIGVPPSQIATILCKETSSISSTRSRLYYKVFGKKGSSKEWDNFIATL